MSYIKKEKTMNKDISFIKFNLDSLKNLKNNLKEQAKIEKASTTNGPMCEEGGGKLFVGEGEDSAPALKMDTKITTCAEIPSEGGGPYIKEDVWFSATTDAVNEQGATQTTMAVGEEGGGFTATTDAVNEEGGTETTMAMGEEGGDFTATTDAVNEEGGIETTMAMGEEGGTVNPTPTPITQPKTGLNDIFTKIFNRIFYDNSFFSRFFNFFN